jgi:amino acid adenylation domain-containing protein
VERLGLTVVNPPTAYWHALAADEPALARVRAGVRLALAGGEELRPAAVAAWHRAPGTAALLNLYGPTEGVVTATAHRTRPRDGAGARVPVGTALGGRFALVLDAGMHPLPEGVPGELYLGGAALARGYHGRPAATAERFVPDPYGGEPGARLYRTGDRARRIAGGAMEVLGRLDLQVKIHGFRVEPAEVEAVLRRHPGVDDCAVVARDRGDGEKRLAAYVVGAADAASLRAHLGRTLPFYMVPDAFVPLDRLPMSPNGKVDRRALPAPEQGDGDHVEPRTHAEGVLAEIWAEVLRLERAGAGAAFAALGGNSLAAVRVVSRVREAFGVDLPVRALFDAPTLAELAERVDALRRAGVPRLPPVVPAGPGPLPLSFAQERLWFLDRLQPGLRAYNLPTAQRLRGHLDPRALERALAEIVTRHHSLRTTFEERDGVPVQVVAPVAAFTLEVEDLSALDPEAREAEAGRRAAREAARPFDLAAGPLFRASLLRLADEDHVLLLCVHHIVSDGWSRGVLFRELSVLYAAYREGGEAALPAPAVQYGDHAAWQREQLRGAVLERETAYWRERLAGAPALLELPTDRPRPPVQSYRGARVRFGLPGALLAGVEALGRSEGATLYMVLLSAFGVLLSRYTGSADVVVGSSGAGRTRREVEELIGFFATTLVLRTDLSGDPPFREVLRRVREAALEAYEHQEVPFERLLDELQTERSLGHNPVFQVFFALLSEDALRLPGVRAEAVPVDVGTAKFDLSLFFVREEHGLRGMLEYATDLFDAATAGRMAAHLEVLLQSAVTHPDRPISALPVATDAERETLLGAWSGAGERFAVADSLHGRFEACASARPDAVAITFDGRPLTYGALNARANRLARRLRALGVAPEARVGLVAERSPELVVGVLAILKAGAAYVPLDPAYPADRLAYMAEDSGIRVLLAPSALRDRVPAEGTLVLALEEDVADEIGDDLGIAADPSNLAYVIYTSGSTGRPKGVGVTHGNVLRLFASTQSGFGFTAEDVWTLFHSYAFDFSVWEIWGALLYGGRLVVVPFDVSRDPVAFRALLERERVTSLSQTPSAFKALARVDEESPGELSSLRVVVFGGEALQYESLRTWLDRYGPKRPRLVNMYGITETTVHVTWHTVTGAELRRGAAGSTVGTAIPDLRAYVLDPAGQPQPVGVPGELYVGGAGLARGYLGRPGLTARRFVPDPFSGDRGARLYRSGDLARWRADGTLEYLGRIDQQVKVRGFRIELGEIESVLLAQPGVSAAAVIVRGEGEDAALAAYVVPAEGAVSASALRDALARQLPDYMVPAAFVVIGRIPLTANGKLDRGALPEPDAAGAEAADAYVAPRTPTEEVLAGIWADVLRLDRVGVDTSFFAIGGHSLRATQVVARIREVFGVGVPLRALFEDPTVAELATRVEAARRAGVPAPPPVLPVRRAGPPPLSFAQERLWFLDRLQPGSAAYHAPAGLRLRGVLHAEALERALGEIVRRHEVLRTTFAEAAGGPVQVIAPFAGFTLPARDLSALDGEAREAEVARRAAADARAPFDLARGPLFRATLLRLHAEEHVLLLCLHHIVTDGWSTGVLFRELSALYAAFAAGGEPPLAEPAVQYADFAAWQREQLRGELADRQLAYWKERLAGAPERTELPADRPRPAVRTDRGARETARFAGDLPRALRALGQREGATLYMVLLAAVQLLLARYSGNPDVVVGSPIAGRTRPELEGLIGFFTNTLVLRTDLGGDPGFREVLRRVREVTLGAYEHQDLPFERVVAELQPERSLSHSPLFQVMFTVEDGDGPRAALPGLRVEAVEADAAAAKFDLSLTFAAHADGLRCVLGYSTDLFERSTAGRMLGHLERLLEQVAADPDVRPSRLEPMGPAERRQVLEEWNDTRRPGPDAPAHVLFARQARRAPDAVALLHGGESVSYGALDRRAETLARHLRALGVGPEVPVGLCVERTPDLLVGVLGIWKAGGAYVPLDPAYPAERLGWIVSDAALPVIVTGGTTAAALPGHRAARVILDTLSGGAEALPDAPERPLPASALAYVIYTSGSTGRPKGVLVQHGSLANLLAATRDAFGVHPGDVMPALASSAFDIWLFETLLPLTSGAAVRLVERERVMDVPALLDEAADATLLHAVPALMRGIAQVEGSAPRLGRLRRAFVGGDRVPADLLAEMRAALPSAETHVLYGPTEGTILASAHPVPADGAVAGHPIGRPLGNVRLYVCDGAGSPQPAGVPGELLIGGAGVARGYLGRPALTAERFVPDPFGAGAGARLYRTGDRARWRGDGTLEYLGRTDGQVKVRGYRIEPGEIEAALRRHPGVRECAVAAREDAGETRLVAYVAGAAPAEALRAHLRRTLPEHMVPAAFVALEALPLSPNGKVDLRALPAPEHGGAEERYVAPRTQVEEVLAGIWAEVLGVGRVGVEESFFELGGHSLLATRVVSRVRDALAVELPLRALFEAPTVSGLAERVAEARGAERLPPVVPVARTGPLPLSFGQERLWFLDRLQPDTPGYNVSAALRLGGALQAGALERALGELVRRHEALRTRLVEHEGTPVQVVEPFTGFVLPVRGLSALEGGEREAEARREAAADAARPFDLAAGPLFRAALLRLGHEEHVLLLCIHHAVSDGWSLGVLFREMSALYPAFSRGERPALPEPPVQYADFAVWQREQLRGPVLERQIAYWKARLEGAPALLELPLDHPRPAVQTYRGAYEQTRLSPELLERLRRVGQGEGATLFMVLLGAFQVLLSRYAGSEDVVVGSPIAGRTRRELEELVGFFVNTLVLRTRLDGDPGFREVLRRVREATLGAYEHQDVPFERLVEELQPERSLGHSPLFQAMFVLEDENRSPVALPGLAVESVGPGFHAAKFDLTLFLAPTPEGLAGGLVYSTDLFDAGTIRRMLGHLERVLEQVSEDPDARVSELELMGEAERRRVVEEWSGAGGAAPAGPLVHEGAGGDPGGHPRAGGGGGPGDAGGGLPWPGPGDGGRDRGGSAGGRCVRAAGPGVPRRAAVVHAGGQRGVGAGDGGGGGRRGAVRGGRDGGEPGGRAGADRGTERGGAAERYGRAEPGVRAVHVGEHGAAQGGGDRARRAGELPGVGGAHLPGPQRGGAQLAVVRPDGDQPVRAAADGGVRGAGGGGGGGGAAGGAAVVGGRVRDAEADADAPAGAGRAAGGAGGGRGRGVPGGGRRGAAGRAPGGVAAARSGGGGGERVRAHGDGGGVLRRRAAAGGGGPGAGADRAARAGDAAVRAGRGGAAGAGGGARGAVRGGRAGGARVPGPAGADGGAVRPGRAGRGGGPAAVPDGGPGAVERGRGAGVPGSPGRAGEGARVPDRAGGGGGGAAAARGGVGLRGGGAGGRVGGDAAGGVRGGRRGGGRAARAPAAHPPGAHGARYVRAGGGAAADAQRQAGRAGAAGAGAGGWGSGLRGAADAGGGGAGGGVGRGAAGGAGGGGRRVLRAGRALAAGDAGGVAGARGVRGGGAAAGALRGADGGGAGGAGGGDAARGTRGAAAGGAGGPRPPAAPLLCPGAHLVPGPDRGGRRPLQRAGGPPAGGGARRRGAGVGAGRGGAAARDPADVVSAPGRHGRAGGGAVRRLRAGGRGPFRAGRRGARGGGAPARGGGGGTAVRPGGGPPLPRGAAAGGGGGPRAPARHAPRGERRVEHGRALPRAGGAVRGVRRGARVAARRAAGAVRRLRGVAARAPARPGDGPAAGVLARPPARRARAAGPPHRPSPPGDDELPRGAGARPAAPRLAGPAGGAGTARRRHAVHGAARCLPGAPLPVLRQR